MMPQEIMLETEGLLGKFNNDVLKLRRIIENSGYKYDTEGRIFGVVSKNDNYGINIVDEGEINPFYLGTLWLNNNSLDVNYCESWLLRIPGRSQQIELESLVYRIEEAFNKKIEFRFGSRTRKD